MSENLWKVSSYETYSPGPGLRANYQAQSNNKKPIFQAKLKYAHKCLKHQNNQKKYYHNFKAGQRILGFGEHNGKINYKIQTDISNKWRPQDKSLGLLVKSEPHILVQPVRLTPAEWYVTGNSRTMSSTYKSF